MNRLLHFIKNGTAFLAIAAISLLAWKVKESGELTWNKTTHDFDRILRGQTYNYRFTFTNSGDEPIIISNVISSSPFATAKWTTTSVRPLASGYVDVSLSPVKAGSEMVSFTVYSNSNSPAVKLWVKGEVMTGTDMKGNGAPIHGTN